jgi:glutathionyl-hydroquinone reductase
MVSGGRFKRKESSFRNWVKPDSAEELLDTMDCLEDRLDGCRYLMGDLLTEAPQKKIASHSHQIFS